MIWTKGLGVFNIIWALILFLLFIGSQFGFIVGLFLGIFCLATGIGILRGDAKKRRVFLRWSIPLGFLAFLNQLGATDKNLPDYIRMDIPGVIQFIGIFILFPLSLNFIILTRPKVKEQFK